MTRRFYLKSFGCKVNQCDGNALARTLTEMGLERTSDPSAAELCIVNGCTVTARADAKCMKLVRSVRRINPDTHIAITGCTAVRLNGAHPERTDADSIVTCSDANAWRRLIDTLPCPSGPGSRAPAAPSARTRAFVKVQDGCDAFCTYCIVPHVRGGPRSMAREQIFAEIERALERGCKEIVLTGTRLGSFGAELDGAQSFASLVAEIDRRYHVPRIRLSSIEPNDLTDELFETFAQVGTVQHHVHVPLQSGDPDVLRRMNRSYTPEEFMAAVGRLRALWPDVGVTTDVLVGFPGETEEAFDNTIRVIEETRFSRLHVFRFSPRPGTPAASMPDRVGSHELHARSRRMVELGNRLAAEFAARQIGTAVEVLVESRRDDKSGHLLGLTGNYLTAVLPDATDRMINCIVPVRVREADGATLICEPTVLSPLPLGEG